MTTKPHIIFSQDLFDDNHSLRMSPPAETYRQRTLSAVTLLRDRSQNVNISYQWSESMEYIANAFSQKCKRGKFWLYACQMSWQPNSAVTRHRRLWKSLEARGLQIPFHEKSEEYVQIDSQGIRCFGKLDFGAEEIKKACQIVATERASFVIWVENQNLPNIEAMISAGWGRGNIRSPNYWRDLALVICYEGNILFRLFGEFDDSEIGLDLIMEQPNMRALCLLL